MKEIIRLKNLSFPIQLAVIAGLFSFVFYIIYGFLIVAAALLTGFGYL